MQAFIAEVSLPDDIVGQSGHTKRWMVLERSGPEAIDAFIRAFPCGSDVLITGAARDQETVELLGLRRGVPKAISA
jgi:hypothetical protein